jgi:hypothetical protein
MTFDYFEVKWVGYPESDNTIEKRSDLIKNFPGLVEAYENKIKEINKISARHNDKDDNDNSINHPMN